ncbi:hypothetical protein Mapa_010283 [Marchantia paleacea]|nr:hypothetical protein Mapa_010283 [Marchantia paleacea]
MCQASRRSMKAWVEAKSFEGPGQETETKVLKIRLQQAIVQPRPGPRGELINDHLRTGRAHEEDELTVTEASEGLELSVEPSEHGGRHSGDFHPLSSRSHQIQLPYLNAGAARLAGAGLGALGTARQNQATISGQQTWVPIKTPAQHDPLRRLDGEPDIVVSVESYNLPRPVPSIGVIGEEVKLAIQRAALVHGIIVHVASELAFLRVLVQHPPAVALRVVNFRRHVHLQHPVTRGQNFVARCGVGSVHGAHIGMVAVMEQGRKLAEGLCQRIAHPHHEVAPHMARHAQQASSARVGDLEL